MAQPSPVTSPWPEVNGYTHACHKSAGENAAASVEGAKYIKTASQWLQTDMLHQLASVHQTPVTELINRELQRHSQPWPPQRP